MELRRTPTIPDDRQFPKPKNEFATLWRQDLDSGYSFMTDPYQAWRAKRFEVKDRLDREKPGYTQEYLENVYESLGLGVDTHPGDFTRGEGILESGSRAMSKAWNSMGQYVDSVQQWADYQMGDMEGVMTQQEQLEEAALENELIDRFQSQTAHGKNAVTQFLFDLASSAPIMVGVMGAGVVAAKLGALAGIPMWIAGALGMAGADALSEMGFNWADIMTNPRVRNKIKEALGDEMSEADEKAIGEATQEILMKEAEGSIAQVGIGNFFNPLNWNPVANKFSRLMKVGSGRMGSIGRVALGTGVRETIEEFAQSVGSQYSAAEAQMQAMSKAGVKDIPQLGVDLKQAGYEALMGFAVGGTLGGVSGTRGYSKYFDPGSQTLKVDDKGNPIFKKPNEQGFIGAGALRLQTRKMIDQDNPVELDDWLNGKDDNGDLNLDSRERLVIEDEIKRMKQGEQLLGDKTAPEKLAQRKENANRFEDYKKDPEAWIEAQKTPQIREEERAQREEKERKLAASFAEVEAMVPEPAAEVKHKRTTALVHPSVVPAVSSILKTSSNQRTPRQKELLRLAQENPEMEYKELDKMVTEIVGQMEKYGTPPPKAAPTTPKETQAAKPKAGKGKPQRTGTEVDTEGVPTEESILIQGLMGEVKSLREQIQTAEKKVGIATGQGTEDVATSTAVGDTTKAQPKLSEEELTQGKAATEIVNTLKSWVGQDKKAKVWNDVVWETLRGKLYTPLFEEAEAIYGKGKTPYVESTTKKGKQKKEYLIPNNIRLATLNILAKQLGITPQQAAVDETVEAPVTEAAPVTEEATTEPASGLKFKKNFDVNNKEINFSTDLDGLKDVVGTEIIIERADTSAKKSYVLLQDQFSAAPRGENVPAGARKGEELKANPLTKVSRIKFMGFNEQGQPYFNEVGKRQDRTGQTAKTVPVKEKEIKDNGAVAHLLGGTPKSFVDIKERKEGKKKFLVASRSYTTALPVDEALASDQATALVAIENDLSGWNLEAEEIEAKGEAATPEEISRYNELIEKIQKHNEEKAELLEQAKGKPDKVTVREGTGIKQEFIPLNAQGTNQKEINTRQKNLRKLLKDPRNKESLSNAEVERILDDIEAVLSKEQLEMDRDYGVELSQVSETKEITTKAGEKKTVTTNLTSLKMSKMNPIGNGAFVYALGHNGWRLVDPEMDAMTENEFEVVVGEHIPIKGQPKFTDPLIIDGVDYVQQEKAELKEENQQLQDALTGKQGDWRGVKTELDPKERADINKEIADTQRAIDIEGAEKSLPGVAWRKAARQWFKTAAAQKNPPKKGREGKSGWTTKQAIDMVRQQMKALDGVTNKEVDSMIDDQILEFLWEGPGEVGRPTIATTVVYDSANPDHKGFNVDVQFKNGVTEEIVPRWGQSIRSYQTLAEVIAESNEMQVDLKPQGGKKGKKTGTKPKGKGKGKDQDKKKVYSAAEKKMLQDLDNLTDEEVKMLQDEANEGVAVPEEETTTTTEAETTTTEEVATPPLETTGENTLSQISEGELQGAMPESDAKKFKSARFNKLKVLPKYRDVSVWDASTFPPQPKGKETAGLTAQIKQDLEEPKATGLSALTNLLRRKLQDYLVLEVQTDEEIEGLRSEIDERYWDILDTKGKTAVNNALIARGSTPILRSKPGTSKKKVKTEAPPIERAGFITDNVASATISDIPTKDPKLNDVWLIDPKETEDLFVEVATEKNLQELEDFLATTNNADFFVVKKTSNWSDAYILFRGETGAPVKGKRVKIPVPQAIRTRLSREGKFFNKQRDDFPLDQHSHKLTREEMTNRDDIKVSSELFMQLFKKAPVDINLLQKALDEDRITFAHDAGIDNFIEVFWKNEDGSIETDGVDNIAMLEFKDRSAVEGFVADIRKKNPKTFDFAEKQYKIMLDKEVSIEEQVSDTFSDASIVDQSGLGSVEDGMPLESSEVPLESYNTINKEVADDVLNTAGWDAAAEAETVQSNIRKAQRQEGEKLLGDMTEEERSAYWKSPEGVARLKEFEKKYFREAEPPPEGAEPVSLEVVNDIVGKFREEFPGSADITVEMGDSPGFKGLYVPEKSGRKARIYLVANEHYSAEDVVQTLWHEGVGHGMQSLMTAEEFVELQQLVETSMPERFAEELKIVEDTTEWGDISTEEKRSIAAQEVLADFANNLEGQSPTLVESVTAWLRRVYNNFARALGLSELNLSEGDVRAILFESANAFKKPRPEGRTDIYAEGVMTPDIETSLRRRAVAPEKTAFNNTNLRESSRAAWDKMYERETDTNTGSWWKNIRQRLTWTLSDPYRIIKDEIGMEEYMVTRLAGRSDGIITTLLKYAGVSVQQRDINGVTVNETVLNPKMKGLFNTLKPLGTVHERKRFFGWIAYNRANNLTKQERETRFSPEEITEGLTWNQGRVKNAQTGAVVSREVLYSRIQKEVAAMNNSVIDLGVKMGLLSQQSANNFEKDFYVPFYRIIEEEIGDGKNGNNVDYNSLTGQVGLQKLKGSNRPIGDPFNNLLHNWLHIIDASIKNDAANTTIRSGMKIKNPMDSTQMLVQPHTSPVNQSNTVRVKQNGIEKRFNINNQLLYQALTALNADTKFPGFKYAIAAKGLFTQIVTANPVFKYNNIIRDTITTAGTTDIGFNLIKNSYGGFKVLKKNEAQMLVSGGYIQFAYTRGDDPKYAETLLNKELTTGYIVENPETDQAFLSALKKANHMRRNLWDKYAKFGDKLENANRAALFESLISKGKSQTEAAFESRDIMDFTLHGGADWVKLVTSLTPFANALIQGKYKVGRAIIHNPKPAAIVAAGVLLASLFEAMMYEDDEEWHQRPDWDKDTFWWVTLPGSDIKWKIPKPHEFSLIGNTAWRALELGKGIDPDYGGALMSGVKTLVSREFGITPIPQIVKPLIEVGMNRNLFFDRDIEPVGSQVRSPSKRYGQYTSETAIIASQALEMLPFDSLKLSPYQLEHLINGYFGWAGQTVLGFADFFTSRTGDFPERPARELSDHPMARRVFKASPLRNTKSGTIFYERLKDLEQAVQDMNLSKKYGHMEEYREIYDDNKDILKFKAFIRKQARGINELNARIKRIRFDLRMGADEKKTRLDRLYQLRNDALANATKHPAFR